MKMKRLATIFGILIVIGILAVPVFAHRGGWGGWMHGPGQGWGSADRYSNLTDDQRADLNKLEDKFFADTSKLRNEIWAKSDELNILLDSSDPDSKKARKLQKEISDLRTKLADKRVDFDLEARKIAPNGGYGRRYGRRHYGGHIMGYGSSGNVGRGPGYCWK
jgi:zinc resistance-associated protein